MHEQKGKDKEATNQSDLLLLSLEIWY